MRLARLSIIDCGVGQNARLLPTTQSVLGRILHHCKFDQRIAQRPACGVHFPQEQPGKNTTGGTL